MHAGDRITGKPFAAVGSDRHGIVATSHPLATLIGLGVLGNGGTAVDATIAAQNTPMNDGGEVARQTGFPYETIRALMAKGHLVA